MTYLQKSIEMTQKLDGPRSKILASRYYSKGNCLLNMRKFKEAVESIDKAISIFEAASAAPAKSEEKEEEEEV